MLRTIIDVTTGEVITRPITQEEIAAKEAAVLASRKPPRISFAQLLIGLVKRGWITEAEGEGWLVGELPKAVLNIISQLPAEYRFAAKARAIRPTDVDPDDPLVNALVSQMQLTAQQKYDFFEECARL